MACFRSLLSVATVATLALAQDWVATLGASTGMDVASGSRPARRNINEFEANGGPAWDLYVQALAAFQAVKEDDMLSYYKIAGIHGLPWESWSGAENVPNAPTAGYCPHGIRLFGPWHRPYLASYEQILVNHAQAIANQYPDDTRSTYEAAAQRLRIPYWDWASDPLLPPSATMSNITINGPNGQESIQNPLYSYVFRETSSGSGMTGTRRCPDASGNSNNDQASANVQADGQMLRDLVYNIFAQVTNWDQMVSMSSTGTSFEQPHNTIHNDVGGSGGTMTDINWSAFDPLFMLHHCNVDRLMAMWQAVNPNSPMFQTNGNSGRGTWGLARNTAITIDTPLKPFYDSNHNFWTSGTAASIRTFGYTYPEIDDWSQTPDELASSVTAAINQLYSDMGSTSDTAVKRAAISRHGHHPHARRTSGNSTDDSSDAIEATSYYTAEVRVERSDLPLPCAVRFSLDGQYVGKMDLLNMPTEGLAYGTITLQSHLNKCDYANKLESDVMKFLKQKLRAEVQSTDGTTVPSYEIPSLKVELHAQDYSPPKDLFRFPKLGDIRKLPICLKVDLEGVGQTAGDLLGTSTSV